MPGIDEPDINKLMRLYAGDAVIVAERLGVLLDFSPESLAKTDSILLALARLRKEGRSLAMVPMEAKTDEVWFASKLWGGYVGEVFLKRWQGSWKSTRTASGDTTVILGLGGMECFPCETVYQILSGEEFKSVQALFRGIAVQFGEADKLGIKVTILNSKLPKPWWKFW